jgi:phenylacetate-CoA ligase
MGRAGELYGRAFRRLLFPAWEGGVRGRPTLALHAMLEQSQWRPRAELEAMRDGELGKLLRHAWAHVPFYRARFDAAGLRPDDLRTAADLARLPLCTRDQAIDAGEQRASTAPPLPTIRKSTGGTTGQPLSFGYEPRSEHWRQAAKLRGWGWGGYRLGMRTLHFWGAATAVPPLAKRWKIALDRRVRRETFLDCNRRGEAELDAVAAAIAARPPGLILCYAQAGGDLARHVNARGLRRWGTIPVLCCAERLFPADRAALEEAFGRAVFETYGCREVMLIASECEAHAGLHLSAENLIVELVVRDGATERPARPGEAGEVVVTDLHNFAMPFIRYVMGDLATWAGDAPCPCGRTLPRLASVDGRYAETLTDGRGGRVNGLFFNILFTPHGGVVRQFQAVQHRNRSVTLKLVLRKPLEEGLRRIIVEECARALPGIPLTIEPVDDLPPGKNGKRRVVIVEA